MRQVGGIQDIDGVREDLVGIVWCLRRYDDARTLVLKGSDGILNVSGVARKNKSKIAIGMGKNRTCCTCRQLSHCCKIPSVLRQLLDRFYARAAGRSEAFTGTITSGRVVREGIIVIVPKLDDHDVARTN